MAFGNKGADSNARFSAEQTVGSPNEQAGLLVGDGPAPSISATALKLQFDLRNALVESFDLGRLASMADQEAKKTLSAAAKEIMSVLGRGAPITLSSQVVSRVVDEILGFGPLEPLLRRDDIADIMVNGPKSVMIEVAGRIVKSDVQFNSEDHLLSTCQKIVAQVGRRVDESSPICDARLLDGSRVNVIVPPLAVDGTALTIRKFKKDRLTLADLVSFGSISKSVADLLRVIGRSRCNVLVSGGTGSGKTTLLNCLTAFIEETERIITCEDTAELQLQQAHVVRLETRPPNVEGGGEVTMRQLVKNCLRMRPDRIIVGEVRGLEAFDLLQAMNTGHDGSMGTIHANSSVEALSRLETMVVGSGLNIPSANVREMISQSVDIVVQTMRLRTGQRIVSQITEVVGMEESKILTQDLVVFFASSDSGDVISGDHRGTGVVSPHFAPRAEYFGELGAVMTALKEINLSGKVNG